MGAYSSIGGGGGRNQRLLGLGKKIKEEGKRREGKGRKGKGKKGRKREEKEKGIRVQIC